MNDVCVVCSNIIVKDSKYLIVKESKKIALGLYSLPSGKLEFGETLENCAIREALEETGFDVKIKRLVGIYQRPKSLENTNVVAFVFLSEIVGGEIISSEKHPEVVFMGLDEIEKLDDAGLIRSKYMIPALHDYLNNELNNDSGAPLIRVIN